MNEYYSLKDILELNISDNIKSEVKDKFNKKVFWDNKGSCKIGTLIGIGFDDEFSEYCYIVDVNKQSYWIPTWKSITKV